MPHRCLIGLVVFVPRRKMFKVSLVNHHPCPSLRSQFMNELVTIFHSALFFPSFLSLFEYCNDGGGIADGTNQLPD